eukprot:gnl/TRDRNA2_/TRDRNA2_133550_c0_seq4.p1 gnl/TRDRNA2_/TRDRNA2_133550_c0~~gnl/TRDRNA2_/TRDRNA2_133550_c0_seq4.p1  ORF type:complete len:352 (-),score=42.86 gnl/TRDRNA2_/TRDRNA2_133550_c0_seq4:505-1560(-)
MAVRKIRGMFGDAPEPTSTSEYHYGQFHLYMGSFFDERFSDIIGQANLVYVANGQFPEDTNQQLGVLLRGQEGTVVVSHYPLSGFGCAPTVLNASWIPDDLGYIWNVGDARPDAEAWEAFRSGALTVDARAYAMHWLSVGVRSGGRSLDGSSCSQKECFENALAADPKFDKAWINLGVVGGGTVDGQQCSQTECFAKAISLEPKNAQAWFNLGIIGGGVVDGKQCTQLTCFEQGLALDPKSATAWYSLGILGGGTIDSKQHNQVECFQNALTSNPKMVGAWIKLGTFGSGGVVDGKQVSQADCFQNAISLDPNSAQAWFGLGALGGGTVRGRSFSQDDCYQRAKALDPDLR